MDLGRCDRCCADFSGGFLQVMSVGTGVTSSDHNSRRPDAGAVLALDHRLNVRIDIAGYPDAGAIVEGAGGGVDQGVLSFGM